jgi:hypothetical protein
MSKQTHGDDGGGCLLIIGLIITAICVGQIYGATAGWLVIGLGSILIGLASVMLPHRHD